MQDYIKTIAEEMGITEKSGTKKDTAISNPKMTVSGKKPPSMETHTELRKPSPLKRLKEAPKKSLLSIKEPVLADADFSSKTCLESECTSPVVETGKAVMAAP